MNIKNCIMLTVCCLLLVGTSGAQTSRNRDKKDPPKKMIAQIVGVWRLEEMVDKVKKRAVERKDTIGMEWVEFRPDGKYKSGSNGQGGTLQPIDSGSYRINEHGLLYLESDLDEKNVSHAPSEWALSLKGDVMTLVGRGNPHAERYQFIYNKVKEGLSTNQ